VEVSKVPPPIATKVRRFADDHVYFPRQIAQVIRPKKVIAAMERAFAAYSNGEAVIPPVGQLDFENPPGGLFTSSMATEAGFHLHHQIATGFWKNPERGLASSNGVVLVFSSETGELLTIFQDEGFLTDMRTARPAPWRPSIWLPTNHLHRHHRCRSYRRGCSSTICAR